MRLSTPYSYTSSQPANQSPQQASKNAIERILLVSCDSNGGDAWWWNVFSRRPQSSHQEGKEKKLGVRKPHAWLKRPSPGLICLYLFFTLAQPRPNSCHDFSKANLFFLDPWERFPVPSWNSQDKKKGGKRERKTVWQWENYKFTFTFRRFPMRKKKRRNGREILFERRRNKEGRKTFWGLVPEGSSHGCFHNWAWASEGGSGTGSEKHLFWWSRNELHPQPRHLLRA